MLHLAIEAVELRLVSKAQSAHTVMSRVLVSELKELSGCGAGSRSKRQVAAQKNGAVCSAKTEGANAERLGKVFALSDGSLSVEGPRRVLRVGEGDFVSNVDGIAGDVRSAEAVGLKRCQNGVVTRVTIDPCDRDLATLVFDGEVVDVAVARELDEGDARSNGRPGGLERVSIPSRVVSWTQDSLAHVERVEGGTTRQDDTTVCAVERTDQVRRHRQVRNKRSDVGLEVC